MQTMCYNCGCHIPQDDMGNSDNITNTTIEGLAKEWKISFEEGQKKIVGYLSLSREKQKDQKMELMFEKAAEAWGQSIEEAKKQTLNLLRDEL